MKSFVSPPQSPTQVGPEDIYFDFNLGARVTLPQRSNGKWRVRLFDMETNNVLFESENQGAFINSTKRWYVRFGVDVWSIDDAGVSQIVFTHRYDAKDCDVLIQFPVGTLGDTLAWFSAAVRFQQRHECRLTCCMCGKIIPLFKDAYPGIAFVTPDDLKAHAPNRFYASYFFGLFFDDDVHDWQPTDFRLVGLHHTASYILGLQTSEEPPAIVLPDESRPMAEPYVCIAVQATTQAKRWNNPHGWLDVVQHLKAKGYRVVCIDQKPVGGSGIVWTSIPHGAEDQTGDRPLTERARWLKHASAFVGLSSGLSWLAWVAGCPVILIAGFSHPMTEFKTPYRVINWHVCNSCWNDVRLRFEHDNHLWCPRLAGTARQFECTSLITALQVKKFIDVAINLDPLNQAGKRSM